MQKYRYVLEKGSKKHFCPNCKRRSFVLFIDTETREYLPQHYGRCDRESKCTYYLNPYFDGYVKAMQEQDDCSQISYNWEVQKKKEIPLQMTEPVFFDFATFKQTLKSDRYEKNIFVQNLFYQMEFPFEVDDVTNVVQLYRLGTIVNGYRAGATTFPFIDINGNIRAIQVKQFDNKNHSVSTDFLHSIIDKELTKYNKSLPEWLLKYKEQDKRISCLFGEHLLSKYHLNPIALVEAPKTAIYGTLYFGLPKTPEDFIWLAVYNKSSFSFDKLKKLQGRDVFVFPDLSKDGTTFNEWKAKASEFEKRLPGTRFIVSNLLERLASEDGKIKGYDLADYLIKQDWRLFRERVLEFKSEKDGANETLSKTILSHCSKSSNDEALDIEEIESLFNEESQNWNSEIAELETYFSNIDLPAAPLQLNPSTSIIDISLFLKSHLSVIKANNDKNIFFPHFNRLQELKKFTENSLVYRTPQILKNHKTF